MCVCASMRVDIHPNVGASVRIINMQRALMIIYVNEQNLLMDRKKNNKTKGNTKEIWRKSEQSIE